MRIGDDAGLAAARAGQDQHRPVGGFDGFALLGVELVEERQCVERLQISTTLILQDRAIWTRRPAAQAGTLSATLRFPAYPIT